MIESKQSFRIGVFGKSGSGKTYFMRNFVRACGFLPLEDGGGTPTRFKKLVIVNMKKEWAEYCPKRFVVRDESNPARALKENDRVFFQVLTRKPEKFLDSLGHAMLEHENVLFLMDESSLYLGPGQVPDGLYLCNTMGRESRINLILISQMLKSPTGAIDPSFIKQFSHVVIGKLTDPNELSRAYELVDEAKRSNLIMNLHRPDDGGAGEFVVKNIDSGKTGAYLRLPSDKTKLQFVDLTVR